MDISTPRGEKLYLDRVSARAQLSEWAPHSPRFTPRRQAELCYTPRRQAERHSQTALIGLPEGAASVADSSTVAGDADADDVCSICLEPFQEKVDTRCRHSFCSACITTLLTTPRGTRHTPCPVCRTPFLLSELTISATGEPVVLHGRGWPTVTRQRVPNRVLSPASPIPLPNPVRAPDE
jgi:hypothetical protein